MQILLYISQAVIPFLVMYIVGFGLLSRISVYDSFMKGAKDGLETVVKLVPTLIGLLMATGLLRESGFLDTVSEFLEQIIPGEVIPGAVWPVAVLRMFSSSAATGLMLDIFKEYGTDSLGGLMASLILSSTECLFYTMSVYFMSVGIKKTRHTLGGALLATFAGTAASIVLAHILTG